MVDATVEVGVGALEGSVGIGWHWVGNRPVQPRKAVSELFVGVVADGDDEVVVMENMIERLGVVAFDAESVALSNGDGPRVDAWAGAATTCSTGLPVVDSTRPTRSLRSQPERVSGNVEITMSSGA